MISRMKEYKKPNLSIVNLELGDNILDPTGMFSSGAGDDLVKGQIFVVEDEEQQTRYENYNIWDEEW